MIFPDIRSFYIHWQSTLFLEYSFYNRLCWKNFFGIEFFQTPIFFLIFQRLSYLNHFLDLTFKFCSYPESILMFQFSWKLVPLRDSILLNHILLSFFDHRYLFVSCYSLYELSKNFTFQSKNNHSSENKMPSDFRDFLESIIYFTTYYTHR